jgi:hypothetical protein
MNHLFLRPRLILLASVLLGILVVTGPVWADKDWFYVHGTSGIIQTPSAVYNPVAYAWGLTFTLSGLSTWVHYAPPSKPLTYINATASYQQWRVRYVRIKFTTGSSDIKVTKIHFYDGNILFKTVEKTFATGWSGYNDLLVDLGQKWNIYRALGVSIEVTRGVESMDHSIQINSVGARWE